MSRSATVLFLLACVAIAGARSAPKTVPVRYGEGKQIATLKDQSIDESSGIAASRRNAGIIWTHNDSGDGPFLYAFDRTGATRGVYHLKQAQARDWEDMAAGPGPDGKGRFLYMGDIGDNISGRKDTAIYRIPEPGIGTVTGTREKPLSPGPVVKIAYTYADGPHNAEALLVHPKTGDIYIVTKSPDGVSGVYVFPRQSLSGAGPAAVLRRVGTVRITGEQHFFPNLITGGDISPDGKRVVLRTYAAAYEWTLPVGAKSFDAIWLTKPTAITLPPTLQGEAIAYATDGQSLLATSEMLPTPLFEVRAQP